MVQGVQSGIPPDMLSCAVRGLERTPVPCRDRLAGVPEPTLWVSGQSSELTATGAKRPSDQPAERSVAPYIQHPAQNIHHKISPVLQQMCSGLALELQQICTVTVTFLPQDCCKSLAIYSNKLRAGCRIDIARRFPPGRLLGHTRPAQLSGLRSDTLFESVEQQRYLF
jgi:hypothetical protein